MHRFRHHHWRSSKLDIPIIDLLPRQSTIKRPAGNFERRCMCMVSSTVLTIYVCFLFQRACNFNSTDGVPGAHGCQLILIYRPNASTVLARQSFCMYSVRSMRLLKDMQISRKSASAPSEQCISWHNFPDNLSAATSKCRYNWWPWKDRTPHSFLAIPV